ncbi:MAG: NAD/NADP octopine/nopaline dehydrogenase family protein [Kiritimatiellia bacterium]|nr:NAD/NADP octopine/nopaline dehydrogenase family protein [Kiritimatiellia bacterium]
MGVTIGKKPLLQRNSAYQDIKAPSVLDYRYFNEDICYGLAPMVARARVFGLSTPVMDSVIQLGSVLLGRDLSKTSLQLADLGLAGIDKQALVNIMKGE